MSMSKRLLEQYKSMKENDGAESAGNMGMGDAAGILADMGVSNSSKYGTNVHKGVNKKKKDNSMAGRILQGLQIVEADETNNPEDNKVVAQVKQDVTVGDLKNASKAAKLLADAGKLDKNTADQIEKELKDVK